ncbi:MAG: hypothetical protein ACP5N2_07155 [Candidatus Nanoarchaeia archaeon]
MKEKNNKNEKNNYMNLNKKGVFSKTTLLLGAVAVLVVAAFGIFSVFALSGGEGSSTLNPKGTIGTNSGNPGDYQTATLKYVNYEYILEPNNLKKDVPVRITVDTNTVVGCMRDIVISDFKIRKQVTPQDNIIEFTPDKEGTFWIVCSMNMGRGTFSVSSDGASTSLQAEAQSLPPPTGASIGGSTCGMAAGGGGCGCGMR